MNREQLFTALPDTKESAVALLRALADANLTYHLDDDPRDIIADLSGERTFTDAEADFLVSLVTRLNELFVGEGSAINAGAWRAAEFAGWVPMGDEEDTLIEFVGKVLAILEARGIDATWEHPGYFRVGLGSNEDYLAIGDANGPWGIDLVAAHGGSVKGVAELAKGASAKELADLIAKAYNPPQQEAADLKVQNAELLAALKECRKQLRLLRQVHGDGSWSERELAAVEAADDSATQAIAKAGGAK